MTKQINATKKHHMAFVDIDPRSLPLAFSSKFNFLNTHSAKLRVVCLRSEK